jgi:hypothetical protein
VVPKNGNENDLAIIITMPGTTTTWSTTTTTLG